MSTGYQQRSNGARNTEASALDAAISATNADMSIARMKMENETIMAECRMRPRNFEEIKAALEDQLKAFPALAYDCIYNKPVGSVLQVTCKCGHKYEVSRKEKNGSWAEEKCKNCGEFSPAEHVEVQKFARGLGVRAAEALAEVYGYNRVHTEVSIVSTSVVKIEATFTDYQGGRVWQDAGMLSKVAKGKGGSTYEHNDDKFYGLMCKAEAARRVREVILRSVNPGLKLWFEEQCEKVIDALLGPEQVDKIVGSFAARNVSLEMIERYLGRTKLAGWTKANQRDLQGVWAAIKDGETTIDAVFFPERDEDHSPAKRVAPSKVNELAPALDPSTSQVDPVVDRLQSQEPAKPAEWRSVLLSKFAEQRPIDEAAIKRLKDKKVYSLGDWAKLDQAAKDKLPLAGDQVQKIDDIADAIKNGQ